MGPNFTKISLNVFFFSFFLSQNFSGFSKSKPLNILSEEKIYFEILEKSLDINTNSR